MSKNKLSEKELERLKESYSNIDKTVFDIGVVESRKHGLLHELAMLNEKLEEVKKELHIKYGEVNIDVNTGEYTDIEKKEEEVEVLEDA